MNEPEVVESPKQTWATLANVPALQAAAEYERSLLALETTADEAQTTTQEQDDLCHGKVPENVWYCSDCRQYFDHRVTGPHPKPVREEKETPLPTLLNRAVRRLSRQMQRQEARQEQEQFFDVGVCRTCIKPFIGANRCQCKPTTKQAKPGQAQLVFVQAKRIRGRAA